jgi:hypothetical protein
VGVTLWHFAERHDGSMRRIPAARFERFWDGRDSLVPSSPGVLRTVQVVLVVERRRVQRLLHANHVRYRVSEDGTLELAHREHAISGIGEWLEFPELEVEPVTNVVDLGPRLAKRDYDASHAWPPTPTQLDEVAAAINAAAVRPPVVVVVGGALQGV